MAILREVFPGYIRIPAEIAWMAFILHQYHAQIENVIGQLSQLNPALDWLNQNTPTCVQVFVVGIASESAGREIPTTMNPVEVGRDIGRTIRDLRGLARVILSLVRFARGSAAAGVTAGFRIFLQLGGPIAERVPQFLQRIRFVRRIVQALDLVSPIDQAAQHVARGISTIESTPRQVQQRMEGDIRQESIARIGEALGLSHEDPRIDQLIRELTNEETATRLIGVLNTFRDLINLCTTLTDAIDHQRPSPTSSGESGGG
jgi:hypothetical protein